MISNSLYMLPFINYDGFSYVSLLYWIRHFVWTIYNFKFVISDRKKPRVVSFVGIKRHFGVLAKFWGFGPTVRRLPADFGRPAPKKFRVASCLREASRKARGETARKIAPADETADSQEHCGCCVYYRVPRVLDVPSNCACDLDHVECRIFSRNLHSSLLPKTVQARFCIHIHNCYPVLSFQEWSSSSYSNVLNIKFIPFVLFISTQSII